MGWRIILELQYALFKDTERKMAYFSLSSQKSKCLTFLSLIDRMIWNQSDTGPAHNAQGNSTYISYMVTLALDN